jgi:hypothetical protein
MATASAEADRPRILKVSKFSIVPEDGVKVEINVVGERKQQKKADTDEDENEES